MRLRSQLLRWLLVPTLALWAVAVVFGYLRSLEQAHEAYDRTLLGAAMVLAERIAADGDELVADVPHAALEMLRTDAHDRVYYRVADWPGTRHVTGYPELAPPQEPPGDEPVVYDAEVRGEPVRVAALRSSAVTPQGPRPLLVLVAETMEARRQLTRRLAVDSAVVQLLLIVAAAALISLGVRLGLAPLRRLRDEVRDRSPNDLTPIETRGVPREVAPLIEAMLNENALGEPMCGVPSRLNRMRSMALASVAVPTVERGSVPIRCWSTMIAVVNPSRTSTSGRAKVGMNPWTKAL
jgi:two-component system sensor histidine kinase TctE